MSNFELEEAFREWWAAQGYAAKPNPHTVTIATAWASTLLPPEPAGADGPAVPESREPASVTGQPTDEELLAFQDEWFNAPGHFDVTEFQRATLARWGHHPAPPAAEDVAELVECLRRICFDVAPCDAYAITRAADLLEQCHPTPVPVSERLPKAEDCDEKGCCWLWSPDDVDGVGHWSYSHRDWAQEGDGTHWFPANALPLPQGDVQP